MVDDSGPALGGALALAYALPIGPSLVGVGKRILERLIGASPDDIREMVGGC